MTDFTFTRKPSMDVAVSTETRAAVQADNTLVVIGRMAATGSTATANTPVQIENYGDEKKIAEEAETLFGAGSELIEMLVAAVKGNKFSGKTVIVYPPIVVLPMANADDDLASALADNITLPMPHVAVWFNATDTTLRDELRDHLTAISASDRGSQGQFGSFGYPATDVDLASATPVGLSAASEKLVIPWLRDLAATKANKIHEVSAAVAAVAAANPAPFKSFNEIVVGGLKVPEQVADHHTPSNAGTITLGLSAGLSPLPINFKGQVSISRLITSRRLDAAIEDYAYFDQMDWSVMYYFRKACYAIGRQERYVRAKNSNKTLKNLMSEIIVLAKDFETQGMFQYVDKFLPEFKIERPTNNRSAAIFRVPFNVVPALHNIAVDATGTDKYDEFEI